MSDDLKAIRELEKLLGRKLKKLDEISWNSIGYTLNKTGDVTGVGLFDCSIMDNINHACEILQYLDKLTKLSLYNNQINDIKPLQNLDKLTKLYLSDNQIQDIKPVQNLDKLTKLYLDYNQVQDIKPLQNLDKLTTLYLADNQIKNIKPVHNLDKLTKLHLYNNQIQDIKPLQNLDKLATLDLGNNQIDDIKPLQNLHKLTWLYLSNNQIKDIKPIENLDKLATLIISGNQISDIKPIQNLDKLTSLYLSDNQISDIKPLQNLNKLTSLDLRNNQIKNISEKFFNHKLEIRWVNYAMVENLNLFGNPLETPPVEIVKQGREAVLRYFASLEGKKKKLNEVKILLVGDGGAGKTSLLKRIFGEPFDKKESQTKGIKIRDKVYRIKNQPVKAHFWDFGGQVIMHSTHQFFLSKRSLYILVLDGRKEEDAEHWLQLIESFGGNSPILVVLNKDDENPSFDVNRRFLMEKYKGIIRFYKVSCKKKTDNGITSKNGLVDGLRVAIKEIEMLGTTWGEFWFKVKRKLEKMKANEKEFIDSATYQEICETAGVDDEKEQDILLEYLHDLGVILHFPDIDLADMHILEPHWVTVAVYRIINSKKLAENHGQLKANDLRIILRRRPGKNDFSYPKGKHHYILTLMEKFELCYKMTTDGDVLVPDLQDVQEPKLPDFGDSPLRFYFEYSFLPSSILPRFTVRMHEEILKKYRWRTGLVLRNGNFNSTAIIKSDKDKKRIYIEVYGDQKRDYFSCIRNAFFRINDEFNKLLVTEWIPLPDTDDKAVTYSNIKGHWEAGEEEYFDGESRKRYSVKNLLDGIETEEERIAKFLQKVGINAKDIKGKSIEVVIKIFQQNIFGDHAKGLQAGEMRDYVSHFDEKMIIESIKKLNPDKLAKLIEQMKEG